MLMRWTSSKCCPNFFRVQSRDSVVDETGEPVMKDGKPVTEEKLIFAITNSMVVTWIVALGLILVAQIATKKAKLVPSGLQNLVEWIVESLVNFFGGILGDKLAQQTFWFFGTAFIFILFSNWFGLVPGVGTVGWVHGNPGFFHSEHLSAPLLRGVNADLNMTASMAIFFFALWFYWSLKTIGPGGFFFHIFNVRGHKLTVMGIFIFLIYIFVGVVEVVSISVRPIALMFRLYGNVFAGEKYSRDCNGAWRTLFRMAGRVTILLFRVASWLCTGTGIRSSHSSIHISNV